MIPHMKAKLILIGKKQQFFFEKPNNPKPKKCHFPAPQLLNIILQKCQGLGILIGLIDAKSIDVAQPIWLSGCPK